MKTIHIIIDALFVIMALVLLSMSQVKDRRIEVLQERAVLEGAATWKINPDTQNKKFVWITDLFE